jgi:hypothetical protein
MPGLTAKRLPAPSSWPAFPAAAYNRPEFRADRAEGLAPLLEMRCHSRGDVLEDAFKVLTKGDERRLRNESDEDDDAAARQTGAGEDEGDDDETTTPGRRRRRRRSSKATTTKPRRILTPDEHHISRLLKRGAPVPKKSVSRCNEKRLKHLYPRERSTA